MLQQRLRVSLVRPRFVHVLVLMCGIGLFGVVPALLAAPKKDRCPAWHAKIDQRLHRAIDRAARDGSPDDAEDVIIQFTGNARAPWAAALRKHGDRVHGEHAMLNAVSARVHADDLQALAESGDVASISIDAPVGAQAVQAVQDAQAVPELVRETLGLTSDWDGKGIGVAVIDSGIEPSRDFERRITAFYDFTAGGVAATPFDDYGHGTHVAGIIGSVGKLADSADDTGLAPRVHLIGLKVLDGRGAGRTSDVIRALEFAVANAKRLRIDVINLSLGHPVYESIATDPLVQAVEAAVRAGIPVVVSAGNHGRGVDGVGFGGVTSPGNAPSAITVGASDTRGTVSRSDDTIADYSSRGPTWIDGLTKPDVIAPGHRVVSNAATRGYLYKTYPKLRVEGRRSSYFRLSGTSMSAAVVSGVVALMIEANRASNGCRAEACSLTPNAIKAVLHYTAFRMADPSVRMADPSGGGAYHTLAQGAGALNGAGAIEVAHAIDLRTRRGTDWIRGVLQPFTLIGTETVPWAQAIVWGDAIMWGDTVLYNQSAWGDAIVWGDSVDWGDAIVWGDVHPVWDDPSLWANAIVWGDGMLGASNDDAIVWGDNADAIVWGDTALLTEDTALWAPLQRLSGAGLALANPDLETP